MPKIAVAGGSSPFTIGLIDALLPHLPELPICGLSLHGRDPTALQLVSDYARHTLACANWTVAHSHDLTSAVRDADFVIHQIRYGGLELRRQGEQLGADHGTLADETLGPEALLTAILIRPALEKTCEVLAVAAPRACVLNLTNPLSLTTSLMKFYGVKQVTGICELPDVTACLIAERLEVPYERLSWEYSGFNHRGFLHNLSVDGSNVLPQLVAHLADDELSGVRSTTIAELEVVPTKYFPLFTESHRGTSVKKPAYRSDFLKNLRHEILEDLKRDITRSPPSLQKRYLEWYPQAVIPILLAFWGSEPIRCIVNTASKADPPLPIIREGHAHVGPTCCELMESLPRNPQACQWLERFEAHERSVLEGLTSPATRDWIHHVLSLDPTIGGEFDSLSQTIYSLTREFPAA